MIGRMAVVLCVVIAAASPHHHVDETGRLVQRCEEHMGEVIYYPTTGELVCEDAEGF